MTGAALAAITVYRRKTEDELDADERASVPKPAAALPVDDEGELGEKMMNDRKPPIDEDEKSLDAFASRDEASEADEPPDELLAANEKSQAPGKRDAAGRVCITQGKITMTAS